MIFSKKKFFRKFDRRGPQMLFRKKDPEGEYRWIFEKIFFCWKSPKLMQFFCADYEYGIYFCIEVQIFSLNHRRKFGGARKYRKKYEIFVFVGKSWMSRTSFFLDVFTSIDTVFHGLSPGAIRFLGALRFCVIKIKIHEKFTSFFFGKSSCRPSFSMNWHFYTVSGYRNR